MSYPPDPNNPYGQQPPPPGYGYPQQAPPPAGYGYPQQAPPPPADYGYGYPQPQVPPQVGYGYPQMPGVPQVANGYLTLAHLGPVRVAGMGQRFLARLLDGVVLSVFLTLAMVAGLAGAVGLLKEPESCKTNSFADYSACTDDTNTNALIAIGVMTLAGFVFMLVYEWLMVSLAGGTVGKLALGLRVVRERDGQNPGLGGAFVRFIIPIAGVLVCYIGAALVYLSPVFDNSGKQQGWHDRAAGTVVIKR
ncbi:MULTISPECIES: RDD family protein [Kitasatospora]|uniref:RDD domain-containing protein n=1 Tax=Kitasatospora setae (strain ATCC 33774 / DSM 43861 / JCM 3304 / KCC A-0304 / NBRC 14216 / KM-6054) TaxID=452652 RepID=E4NCD8_KITSK|nr:MULTISPECIES: RDD family protein [Kitasatospora]BAJ28869.1 hypothetical protein KSE_30580 [Kitasatospora setae KM-6054]